MVTNNLFYSFQHSSLINLVKITSTDHRRKGTINGERRISLHSLDIRRGDSMKCNAVQIKLTYIVAKSIHYTGTGYLTSNRHARFNHALDQIHLTLDFGREGITHYKESSLIKNILITPVFAAERVEILNNLRASFTSSTVASGDNLIFANDSAIRTIASS